jgi:3-phenylpropionate/cinnamic acid dioxygenase small subunit
VIRGSLRLKENVMSDAAARAEIRNLLARYCHHLDNGRADDLASLFAANAELEVMGTRVCGRDAIRTWFDQMGEAPALSVHLTTNTAIEVDGETATAMSNWFTLRLANASRTWHIFAVGTYEDEFAATPDGWRFTRRIDSVLGGFSLEETIAAYLAAD